MKKQVKIALIIGGVAAIGVGAGITINSIRKKKKREEEEKRRKEEENALEQQSENLSGTQDAESSNCDEVISPLRNLNKDINNAYADINGTTLYPAQKTSNAVKGHNHASGYSNIRNSAEVNNKTSTFDISNLIGKITSGKKIGVIIGESYDNQEPSHRWFKVKLNKKMEDCSGYTGGFFGCDEVETGWVRADTVTFNPFKNKNCNSNFSGSEYNKMVKRYKPVGLGVEVAPFYNWKLPQTTKFECGEVFD